MIETLIGMVVLLIIATGVMFVWAMNGITRYYNQIEGRYREEMRKSQERLQRQQEQHKAWMDSYPK